MPPFSESEIVAIAGGVVTVISGFFGLILKMWRDHTALANRVTQAMEKNAVANEKLANAVASLDKSVVENTQATKELKESTKEMKDNFTQLLLQLIKGK